MNKIDWVKKLTSRKFWAAVVGFATPIVLASGGTSEQVTRVTALIMSGAALIAYIIGEGLTDAANGVTNTKIESENTSAIGFNLANEEDENE
jgi:hypothetical protein